MTLLNHPAFDMKANQNYLGDRPGFAFMGLNIPVLDYDCVRDKFLGIYNTESSPDGVENGQLSNSSLRGGVGCGALRGKKKRQWWSSDLLKPWRRKA